MRVCLVYDHFYPLTLGGAERWLTGLADGLADEGHSVTYLTMRHWDKNVEPTLAGVQVVAVGRRHRMYRHGRRTMLPPLIFGTLVLVHLFRHRRAYDAVHLVAFPYFAVLAAAAVRPVAHYQLLVDWFEVWTPTYWRQYLGRLGGTVGWFVQRACIRVTDHAFCFSRMHSQRLRDEGFDGPITILGGLYQGLKSASNALESEPLVIYAGRFIPEKRVPLVVLAIAAVRERLPHLCCEIYGGGPEESALRELIRTNSLADR